MPGYNNLRTTVCFPLSQHRGFYFPPSAAQMVPLSPERETYGIFLFIQLLHSCLLRRGKSATCYRYSYTLTYRILLSPTSQRLAVRPFSPERETFEPLPLSIQIHSVRLHCLFSPRYLYLHQKMYIYYFMLYLAESLTGRSYTEGQLAKRFPLWRERGTICCADGGK